jgi:alkylation response protein AidB-like acyl-CoA dehydrogenase
MHLELTPQQTTWQANAVAFARDRVAAEAARIDELGEFPTTLVREAGSLGYLGLLVPRQFGGKALDHVSYALAIEAVARASATVAVILAVHNSLVSDVLARVATVSQQQQWLPRLASGETLGAFALTEADAGSPTARSPASRWSLPLPIQARVVVACRHSSSRSTGAVCDAIPASTRSVCAGWVASTWCWTRSR